MRDRIALGSLTFAPVVHKQEAATLGAEPVDQPATLGLCALKQTVVTEPKQVGVELARASERQRGRDLARVVPAGITEGFHHQKLEGPTFSPGFHCGHCKHCECSTANARTGTREREKQHKLALSARSLRLEFLPHCSQRICTRSL